MDDPWSIVPEASRAAAQDAARAAFGRRAVTHLERLIGGNSAQSFRLQAGGRPYVLRIEAARGGIRDPDRSYACLQAGRAAGLTPAIHALDAAQGVAILDFIAPRPLADFPGGAVSLSAELGRMVGRLQTVADYPKFAVFPVLLRAVLDYVRDAGLFTPGRLDRHGDAFEALAGAYPWREGERVASHNDMHPGNLIFDGERLWLIDWEMSFRNDRYFDLALITADTATTPEAEAALLAGWAGRAPAPREADRLAVMKPLARFWHAVLVLSGLPERRPPGSPPIDDLGALTREALRRVRAEDGLRPGSFERALAGAKTELADFIGLYEAPQTQAAMARLATG